MHVHAYKHSYKLTYIPTYQPTYLHTLTHTHIASFSVCSKEKLNDPINNGDVHLLLYIYQYLTSIYLSVSDSIINYENMYLFIFTSINIFTDLPVCLFVFLLIYLTYLSIHLSIYLSIYLSISLNVSIYA